MALKAVTLGTDGLADYIELPDGVRYLLGSVSIYRLVRAFIPGVTQQKQVMNRVLKGGTAVVTLDTDRLFEFLRPRVVRNASPLIPPDTTRDPEDKPMNTRLAKNLRALELQATYLTKLAGEDKANPAVWEDMQRLASTLLAVEEGEAEQETQETQEKTAQEQEAQGQETQEQESQGSKTANLDAFRVNTRVADEIIEHLGETSDKIQQLVRAGRKFNAARAQADLHKVALQVEEILTQTDLGQPWVRDALQRLAAEASRLHGLFAPVDV